MSRKILITIAVIFSLNFIISILLYFYKFNSGLSNDTATWGQYGDFFGGILNPTLSFISIMLLLETIKLQEQVLNDSRTAILLSKEELELSRTAIQISSQEGINQNKKLEHQIFETTFFNLVKIHSDLLASITRTISIPDQPIKVIKS